MRFQHQQEVAAPRERVWALLMDIPRAARCLPGAEQVTPLGDGSYEGAMKIKVGPISLNLRGKLRLESQDEAQGKATLRLEGADRQVGGAVNGLLAMELTSPHPSVTHLLMTADITFMGRLAQFGQPLIKKKADGMVAEFTRNLAKQA